MFFFAGLAGLFIRFPLIFGSGDLGGINGYIDPRFKRVLWYLIGSTKGGVNRAKIIDLINSHPANANQIASELKLDYKTVIHHLRVLSDYGLNGQQGLVRRDVLPFPADVEELSFVHGDIG